ncbi:MobF family relaxase [Nubsella zeaxanthinifaciens]|uniref:MobF family relaxase n=1 Tax=Nubsella zeaxanthinifaciens TaxID=392412 RepID=UPI003CFE7C24
MIRMIQSTSSAHAKDYFSDALSRADYYIDGQEQNGNINGKLASRLGLSNENIKEVFYSLADNINPVKGQQLTPRSKQDRTVGYDINFHCPKSVSIIHVLSKDDEIQKAFEASVQETMREIEADAMTRVRMGGKHENRKTDELIWADFTHHTARPVDGHTPDPHLHSHCYVFNVTYDKVENKFKAAQFRDINRDMPYYQSRFHKRLSDKLIDLGYNVRRTDKSFELAGVPENVIKHFSKRTDEIGRIASEKGITNAEELSELGARTRSKKQKGLSMSELKDDWKRQIAEIGENKANEGEDLRFSKNKIIDVIAPSTCIDFSIQHTFERASVMDDRRLLEKAYRHGIGDNNLPLDRITDEFYKDQRLIRINEYGRSLSTTRAVLAEEQEMVKLARQGLGKHKPLYYEAPQINLIGQQYEAVRDVLTNRNLVSIVKGAAGSGKTTLLKETDRHIKSINKEMFVLAPTAEASRGVLVNEGFKNAETVASFLLNKNLQNKAIEQVIWVDEAGLLGTQDTLNLIKIAKENNSKIIFGGDTKQHASVVRGDALRILNTVGNIRVSEVNRIYRQKNEVYKSAVESLSKGDISTAFIKLNDMGAIKTVEPTNPNTELVDDYVSAVKKGKSAIVISPTHSQGESVTNDIRKKLRENGLLGKTEIKARKLTNANFTDAEKSDYRNYSPGQYIQFNQNLRNIKKGSQWKIDAIKEGNILISNNHGKKMPLPHDMAKYYEVFEQSELSLSKGDKVRITKICYDNENKRLNNGQSLQVLSVKNKNLLLMRNEISGNVYTVNKDFGHIAHAHCITSYASQGKTVDEVFISQPSSTFPATDAKQMYVSVSRGREATSIYTDDKEALLEYASMLNERRSAMELLNKKDQQEIQINRIKLEQSKDYPSNSQNINKDNINLFGYEPER